MLQATTARPQSHTNKSSMRSGLLARLPWPAIWALALGALVAYSGVAWVLQMQGLSAPFSQVPEASSALLNSPSGASTVTAADKTLVAQALGAPTSKLSPFANAALDANPSHQWTLLGVVAGSSGRGSALLSVDGQPPKAYLPGQTVAPGWVLHSVGHRVARLSSSLQDTPTVVLDMPKQDN